MAQVPAKKKITQPSSSASLPREDLQTGPTGESSLGQPSSSVLSDPSLAGSFSLPPEPDDVDFDHPHSSSDVSSDHSESDEGEISSDTLECPDLTEEMSYRETVRSIRSFMGWTHIPDFESDLNEPDKSNNPWKGKNPKRPVYLLLCRQMTGSARN